MSLPPLYLLDIDRRSSTGAGANPEANPSKTNGKRKITPTPIPILIPIEKHMCCVQVTDTNELKAAHSALEQWSAYSKETKLVPQHDNEEDHMKHESEEEQLSGEAKEKLIKEKGVNYSPLPYAIPKDASPTDPVLLHKKRLIFIVGEIAKILEATVHTVEFATTITKTQGTNNYKFHQDLTHDSKIAIGNDLKTNDFIQLTLVYYLVAESDKEAAENSTKVGQGSTLYKGKNNGRLLLDGKVSHCALRNGSISVFDGSHYHAVGPNFGVERGAVVYKVVLHGCSCPPNGWWKAVECALNTVVESDSGMEMGYQGEVSLREACTEQPQLGATSPPTRPAIGS
jgi:hypothetical protein